MKIDSSEINKTKATVVNLLFNYGTTIVLIINSIVLVPFYLNYMSFSEYGAWLTAIATINIIMIIDPGISSVSSQRLSQFFSEDSDKDFQSTFLSSLLIASFFTVLTFFIGIIISFYVPALLDYKDADKIKELNNATNIYIAAICLVPIYSILSSFLQSLLQTFKDNIINFLSVITSPFIIVIGLINDLGILSLALGIFIPNLIRVIVYSVLVSILWGKYLQERFLNFSNLNLFSLYGDIKFLYLRRFSSITSENIETAVAGIIFSTEIAAFISIIKRIFAAIQMFSTGIATSTYTSLSHVFSGIEISRLRDAIEKTIYSFQLIHLFGTTVILASVGPLIFLWLQEDLIFEYSFVLLMAFNVFLVAKLNLLNTILYTSGDYKSVAYISIFESLIRISLTYFFVKFFGIYGLPLAGIISSTMAILYVVQKIKEKTEQEISDLLFPGSGYEFIIYLTAVLIGFYNITKGSLIDNLIVITFVTLFLTFLILFSKKVRILLQLVLKTIK